MRSNIVKIPDFSAFRKADLLRALESTYYLTDGILFKQQVHSVVLEHVVGFMSRPGVCKKADRVGRPVKRSVKRSIQISPSLSTF